MTAWSTEFETGLLDDFDFTIERAFFAPDAKYNDGKTLLLQWEGKTDNLDQPETHVWFPLGNGWVSSDGGKTIRHESGKEGKYFVKSSLMARLIARCVEDFQIGEILGARGGPLEAVVWPGLQFHMKNEVISYGAGLDPSAKVMPNAFLGVKEGVSGGAGAPAVSGSGGSGSSAADKIAEAKARAAAGTNGGGVSAKDQVIALFKTATDFQAAQNAALSITGVTDDSDLLDSIMSESGLWSEVKAGV